MLHFFPESVCGSRKFLLVVLKSESFQTIRKVYRQTGEFPDNLESFQTVSNVSIHFGRGRLPLVGAKRKSATFHNATRAKLFLVIILLQHKYNLKKLQDAREKVAESSAGL